MIHISQGHELSVGPEVFFKSCLLFNQDQLEQITFHGFKESIQKTLKSLNLKFQIHKDSIELEGLRVKTLFLNESEPSESTASLNSALSLCKREDILLTLPTSKDQLLVNSKSCAGYTEFFREHFQSKNLSMCFKGGNEFFLLLTDHIAHKEVTTQLTPELFKEKVENTIKGLSYYFNKPKDILLAGVNPHAGENGILGDEEINLKDTAKLLKLNDFIPGDTLHFHSNDQYTLLRIYTHHEQALPLFKATYGLMGINITFGLPFLRFSVDHGTAFSLYGKNKANPMGCFYVLKEALKVNQKLKG